MTQMMKNDILKIDSPQKALSFLMALGSLALIVYGGYGESYWLSFGFLMLVTSLLLVLSLSGPKIGGTRPMDRHPELGAYPGAAQRIRTGARPTVGNVA
jgi:hypothetical protein